MIVAMYYTCIATTTNLPSTAPDSPTVSVTTTQEEATEQLACICSCSSIIGTFSGILAMSVIINLFLVIVVLVLMW